MANLLQSSTLTQNINSAVVAVGVGVGIQYITVAASPTSPVLAVPYKAFVDNEIFTVVSDNGSGLLGVERGQDGTRTHAHLTGRTIWYAPNTGAIPAFGANLPGAAVTAVGGSGLLNSPDINVPAVGVPFLAANPGGAGTQINYYYPWESVALQIAVTGVTTGAYAVLVTDCIVEYTALAAGSTVTLPAVASVPVGKTFIIKDGTGNAGTNTITVSPNIEGGSKTITANYGVLRIYKNSAGAYATF